MRTVARNGAFRNGRESVTADTGDVTRSFVPYLRHQSTSLRSYMRFESPVDTHANK